MNLTLRFIEIIPINESEKWDYIVKSFANYDVYYLSGYIKAYQLHGDGEPQLYYYNSDGLRGICAVLKRDIADMDPFKGILSRAKYYDIITPYGYGGFLFEGNISPETILSFHIRYTDFLQSKNIISEFVRFHPLLHNADILRDTTQITDLGNTISIDLRSTDEMWMNIRREHRNRIRKAEKCGVTIHHEKSWPIFEAFIKIYNETMSHDQAQSYYFFDKEFYASIHNDLYDNYEMFYATYQDKIISMSIMIYANNKMYYHFSGTDISFRYLSPSPLLLYKAACWGHSQGFHTFNLGGGVGSHDDSLYQFKKKFNKNSLNLFSIGKRIANPNIYYSLIKKRQELDPSFNPDNSFFPAYRS